MEVPWGASGLIQCFSTVSGGAIGEIRQQENEEDKRKPKGKCVKLIRAGVAGIGQRLAGARLAWQSVSPPFERLVEYEMQKEVGNDVFSGLRKDSGHNRITGIGSRAPAAGWARAALLGLALTIAHQAGAQDLIKEYPIPSPSVGPCHIISGADHAEYFIEIFRNRIGRRDPTTGEITEYEWPSSPGTDPASLAKTAGYDLKAGLEDLVTLGKAGKPIQIPAALGCGITSGPDKGIWFSEPFYNKIGRLDIYSHHIDEWTVPTPNTWLMDFYSQPNSNLVWWSESNANQIGSFNVFTHEFKEYKAPTPNSYPIGLFSTADGAIWFPEFFANQIARMDPQTHKIEEYKVPTPNSLPFVARVEADGGVWFTEFASDQLGRVDEKTHEITEYPIPTKQSGTISLALSPDKKYIYYDEALSNKIGRLNLATKKSKEWPIPTANSFTDEIRTEPDGLIWFSELLANKLMTFDPKLAGGDDE